MRTLAAAPVRRRRPPAVPRPGGPDPDPAPAASAVRNPGRGFGPHLVFDAHGCPAERLDDIGRLFALLDTLPDRLGMAKVVPPCVVRRASPEGGGLSGFVLMAASHIAVHTFPQRRFLNVDVFSSRALDVEVALAAFKEEFRPRRVEWKLLDRRLGFPGSTGAAHGAALQDRAAAVQAMGLEAAR